MFAEILTERRIEQNIIFTPEENLEGMDAISPDLLIVMGGPMGVYEADRYPYLSAEINVLKQRLKAKKPVLGICLGAQLMTAALGENVYKGNAGKEIGWTEITLEPDAALHPVRHLSGIKTFHWHGDTFDLPAHSKLLASSRYYKNQAYWCGENALALQFHPEVTELQLAEWFGAEQEEIAQTILHESAHELQSETYKNIKALNKGCRLFFNEWLDSVGL